MITRDKYINGTLYHAETTQELVEALEQHRKLKTRLKIYYGDATGKAWGDAEIGRIRRIFGRVLVISNKRETNGCLIFDHCIVKIEYTNKKQGGVIYQHPNFKE